MGRTDRGDDPAVPLQHHVDVLHHAQQVEEATAAEETGRVRKKEKTKMKTDCIRRAISGNLLIETLLIRISQQPPVLSNFHQTVNFVTQLQIFTVQTLGDIGGEVNVAGTELQP